MRIIGLYKNGILPYRYPTILVRRGIIQQPGTHRPMVVPQLASSPRVQGKDIVGRCHEHYAPHDYRCCFQVLGVTGMEDPCRSELVDICGIDFPQSAITAPRVVAVVRGPVRSDWTRQQVLLNYGAGGDYRTFLSRQWDANQHGKNCEQRYAWHIHFSEFLPS